MVVRCYVFETMTGALVTEVSPSGLRWSEPANQAETVSPTFDLNTATEGSRDWRSLGAAWKHSIAIDVNGRLLGGPIMPHNFDDAGGTLQITARGGRMLFTRRSILPVAAMPPRSLLLSSGDPDTSLDSTWTGYDLGTIAKKIGMQACTWPGGNIPIVWHEDRPGSHERSYPAIDLKKVDSAWADLSKVENGPDIRMRLQWNGAKAFRWVFETGTQEQPRLQGQDVFAWEIGQGSGLSVQTDPTSMGSISWSRGGRADDTALVRSMYKPTLIDHGYPMLELESDASTNTVEESTLDSWNAETLRTASKPWEFWSFNIRADQSPYPHEYGPGSLINVVVTEDTRISGGYVPTGTHPRRIVGLSGSNSDWITVTCGAVYE